MSQAYPLTVTLRGAWQGQVGDPARRFQGTVTESGHSDVAVSSPAQVVFEHSGQRVSGASDHGTYVLTVNEQRLPLMSFTCHSTATTGSRGHDDTQEADWRAQPLTHAG